jgi:hypothetical protein
MERAASGKTSARGPDGRRPRERLPSRRVAREARSAAEGDADRSTRAKADADGDAVVYRRDCDLERASLTSNPLIVAGLTNTVEDLIKMVALELPAVSNRATDHLEEATPENISECFERAQRTLPIYAHLPSLDVSAGPLPIKPP